MASIENLTEQQFIDLLDGYFASPEKRRKMTTEEIRQLAEQLNKKINVPIINETKEEKILIKVVIKIDAFLYDNLPNEFYDLVRSVEKGVDDDEAKRLINRLTTLANNKIDIPYLPEVAEKFAIKFVISVIINASRKHWDMIRAKKQFDGDSIQENSEFTLLT